MNRLVLSLCLGLMCVMSAYAGCVTTEKSWGIMDEDLLRVLNKIARVAGEGSPQLDRMMAKGLEDGNIIVIPAKTKIDSSEESFLTNCSLVRINGITLFIPSKYISCD